MPAQVKLATRRGQPVDDQQLQYFFPPNRCAPFSETLLPERLQPQFSPQLTRQPAVPKYTRASQLHFSQPHLNPIADTGWNRVIVGKQAHRRVLSLILVENCQTLAPRFFLLVVDFAQIQHRTLRCATRCQPSILNDAEIPMNLTVFLPLRTSQKHSSAQCQNPSG